MNNQNPFVDETAFVTEAIASTDPKMPNAEHQVRKCSFEPKKFLINIEQDPNKPPRLYLQVERRLYWLQVWCEENAKKYCVEEHEASVIPGTHFLQARCTIYIDNEIAAIGSAGVNLDTVEKPVQSCLTIAKGRALANAGFGSVFSAADTSENGTSTICDSGMGTDFYYNSAFPLDPALRQQAPLQSVAEPTSPTQKEPAKRGRKKKVTDVPAASGTQEVATPTPTSIPAAEPPAPPVNNYQNTTYTATHFPQTNNAPSTREEALKFVVNMKGKWFGHPLWEVLAKDESAVRWYAQNSRIEDLKVAAQLALNK